MRKISIKVGLLIVMLMLPWIAAQAAGLGKLTLNSALGQPLNAEVDIVTADTDEVSSLKASIANRETFTQAGINYENFLSTVKVSIESRINGDPYIKLSSPQAINDPFLIMLLELNWSAGRVMREYAVLLDPVESDTQKIAAANFNPPPMIVTTRLDGEKVADIRTDHQETDSIKPAGDQQKQSKRNKQAEQIDKVYGPVSRGDTLSSIARKVLPDGINLNQMLVALYRANQDAFIANNMNLLRTGTVLRIPEQNEITAIKASEAAAEVKMQVGSWRNYQGKLAVISKKSPSPQAIHQTDQGQITTRIEKEAITAKELPEEVLKLSSGSQLPGSAGQVDESSLVNRLRTMEEDAIAKNLALQEANQRVAILEKSVENLKQLLELKDSLLAQAQIKAESTPSSDGLSKAEPVPLSAESSVELMKENQPVPTPVDIQNSATDSQLLPDVTGSTIEPVEKILNPLPPPASAVSEELDTSMTDLVFEYIEYVAIASVLLLFLILLILRRRRNRSNETDDDDQREKISSTKRRVAELAAANTNQVISDDTGASVYEDVNDEVESEALEEDFDKDGYYEEDNMLQSEDIIQPQHETDVQQDELVAESDNQSSDTDNSIDFPNEIDFDLSDESEGIKPETKDKILDNDLEMDLADMPSQVDLGKSEDFSPEIDEEDEASREVDSSEIDLTDEEPLNEESIVSSDEDAGEDSTALEFKNEPLEFEPSSPVAEESAVTEVPALDLTEINLDLDDVDAPDVKEKSKEIELSGKSEHWQEVETKLDLAKAYQEMEDKEGAKEMLEEVIRDGDAKQKKAAKQMLKNL